MPDVASNTINADLPDRLAELHVHLEGAVRHSTAVELAQTNGLPAPPEYSYSDLPSFLAVYAEISRCLVTAADFERAIVEHAEVMSAQNIRYAEISFNPSLHPGDAWLGGVASGRRRARDQHGVVITWLIELVRGATHETNQRALDIALSTEGVVGLGLVGDESIPSSALAPLIQKAGLAGLGFMPHAGQVGGAGVIREAVEVLGARRIAHGVSAIADEALMTSLARKGVCLCICPSSNARIGLKPDYAVLAAHGIPLTVNTDDPTMVGTTLEKELEVASAAYGLNRGDLVAAAWNHRFQSP
jgi:aminodeoxyfutalosine deaminase